MRFSIHEILTKCPAAYYDFLNGAQRQAAGQIDVDEETARLLLPLCGALKEIGEPKFPSFGQQIRNAGTATGRALQNLLIGRHVVVPKEVQQDREAICKECPENLNGRCRQCGCGVKAQFIRKTRFATERCPLDPPRWLEWSPAPTL